MWSVAIGVKAKFVGTSIVGQVVRKCEELDGSSQWGFRYVDGDGVIQTTWVTAGELEAA
jgi:hypothetical protein